jgi:hypothetical protein
MVQASQRTTVRGPTFIRLLARLTDVGVTQSNPSLSDRLSQWLDWTHSIALSTALDGRPAAPDSLGPTFGSAEEEECARMRDSLAHTISNDAELATLRQRAAEQVLAGNDANVDYTAFRQRYLTLQRRMLAATGHLRGRLRDMLAQQSAEKARLAEVDAVMERALSPREQTLLAAVPTVLGDHFERLRHAEHQALAEAPGAENTAAWLDVFCRDMQSVLLAELDVRFQPVEGLLAALRTR